MSEQGDDADALWSLIHGWLADPDGDPQQLLHWLAGYDLPAFGHDEEPFILILRGLSAREADPATARALAVRLGALLSNPSLSLLEGGDTTSDLAFNLLMLSAALSSPDHLGDPLYRVYEESSRQLVRVPHRLRAALFSALATNQLDDRLEQLWTQILSPGSAAATADPIVGFEGIRLMPPSRAQRGTPALAAIGSALASMATVLIDGPRSRTAMRDLIRRTVETYPGRPTWPVDLIRQADAFRWPDWALTCLPSLAVRQEKAGQHLESTLLLWAPYLPLFETASGLPVVLRSLCDGLIFEIPAPPTSLKSLAHVLNRLEERRLSLPFRSYRSVLGAVNDTMAEFVAQFRLTESRQPVATAVRRAHLSLSRVISPS